MCALTLLISVELALRQEIELRTPTSHTWAPLAKAPPRSTARPRVAVFARLHLGDAIFVGQRTKIRYSWRSARRAIRYTFKRPGGRGAADLQRRIIGQPADF